LLRIQEAVRAVYIADAILDYTLALIARTRVRADLKLGLSPRAGQGLIRAAQAWAYLENRAAVMPEDVQAVLPAVIAHRLERREAVDVRTARTLTDEILKSVPVPL
jgi:MoxR-like ATPase